MINGRAIASSQDYTFCAVGDVVNVYMRQKMVYSHSCEAPVECLTVLGDLLLASTDNNVTIFNYKTRGTLNLIQNRTLKYQLHQTL